MTEMIGKIALITLAIASILMIPALSMPEHKGAFEAGHCGMQLLANNMTQEELNNMTLGQIQEMRKQIMGNETCSAKVLRENRTQGCPAIAGQGCMRNGAEMKNNDGRMGAPGENDHNGPMAKGSLILLLMDDLTLEEINNMTPNQITELKQQKSEELNNMTLNQIKELKEKKTQEQNNMTLGEFREKNQEMHKISAILGMGQGKFGFGKGLGKMMQGDESMRGGSCAKANQGESKPEMSKN